MPGGIVILVVVLLLWLVVPLPLGLLIGSALRWSREGRAAAPAEAAPPLVLSLAEAA